MTSANSRFLDFARNDKELIATVLICKRNNVAYSVSKLTDYSASALEKAAGECVAACAGEAGEVRGDAELKAFRDRWLARKNGILTQINEVWLKGAPKEAKREAGIRVNELKARI